MTKTLKIIVWILAVAIVFAGIVALSTSFMWAKYLFATLTTIGVAIGVWTFWIKPFVQK